MTVELNKKDFDEMMDTLYQICRSTGKTCEHCPFDNDPKIKYEIGYEEDQFVEMCPLDVSLLEWRSPMSMGRGNKVHPWIIENLDKVYTRYKEYK